MIRDIRHDGSFIAVGADGDEYMIDIFTEVRDAGSFENPNATIDGMKSLRLRGGGNVNRLDKGKYEIVQTGVVVQSTDPDAP